MTILYIIGIYPLLYPSFAKGYGGQAVVALLGTYFDRPACGGLGSVTTNVNPSSIRLFRPCLG